MRSFVKCVFALLPIAINAWSVVFLGVGVGAIAQVIAQIGRRFGHGAAAAPLSSGPVLGGLVTGFAVMYVTGMLIG